MQEENYESRIQYLEGKTELSDEDLATVVEFRHEYPDMNSLKKYTGKKYRDLTKDERQELIVALLNDDEYLKYKNCYIAKSKLLYDSSETLIKETAALSRLNDLGYEVYLLPYAYARDSMNCYQKSADSITAGDFLEMKSVVSTGKNAGYSTYKDARQQADNIYLSFVNDVSEEKAINNVYRAIGGIKDGNRKNGHEDNFSGYIFLNFEKTNEVVLYEISKDGLVTKVEKEELNRFKKIEGVAYDNSQVEENPMTEHGSSPIDRITEGISAVNEKIKGTSYEVTSYDSPQVVANPMTEHGSSRDSNIPHSPEKSTAELLSENERLRKENIALGKQIIEMQKSLMKKEIENPAKSASRRRSTDDGFGRGL